MTGVRIRPVKKGDRDQVVAIFNHYVGESHAAFPDQPVEPAFFDFMLHGAHGCYVAEDRGKVVGFSRSSGPSCRSLPSREPRR